MTNDEYHDITRSLVAMMANQDRINVDVRTAITVLTQTITRLTTVAEDIKTLLARNLPLSENGTDG
jgi:hypothetical protein